MEPFLLNPQSLQHLAQIILAGVLSAYLFTRSQRAGTTRDLAFFFAVLTLELALLFLDQVMLAPGAKAFMDATPAVFQIAGAILLVFACGFPDVRPGTEARWAVRAAWLAVLVDVGLAGPNIRWGRSSWSCAWLPIRQTWR